MINKTVALRAWADLVEHGYEVPKAGQVMRDAADELDKMKTENAALKQVLLPIVVMNRHLLDGRLPDDHLDARCRYRLTIGDLRRACDLVTGDST